MTNIFKGLSELIMFNQSFARLDCENFLNNNNSDSKRIFN